MTLIQNLCLIRLKLDENHALYWTGNGFTANPAFARNYRSPERAHRMMRAIVRAVKSGLRRPDTLGIHRNWTDIHGLFQTVAVVSDYRTNRVFVPTGWESISWLKGHRSYTNE